MAEMAEIAGRFPTSVEGVYIYGYIARGLARSAQSFSTRVSSAHARMSQTT
jgi:hypothetical protein